MFSELWTLTVTSNWSTQNVFSQRASVANVRRSLILFTLIMEVIRFFKRRFLQVPHGVTSQKTEFFMKQDKLFSWIDSSFLHSALQIIYVLTVEGNKAQALCNATISHKLQSNWELCSPPMKWYTFWVSRFKGTVVSVHGCPWLQAHISLTTTALPSQEGAFSTKITHGEFRYPLFKSVESNSI
jgi:hypothetical protein